MRTKILFIAPLPPPVHGSSMVSQYIQKSKLLNEAFDMEWVNLSTSRTMEEIGKSSLTLYFKKLFRFLASYFLTIGKLLKKRYDLCYIAITCHGVGFLKDMPFVLLCKMFCRRVVLHQHNKGMSNCVDRFPYKQLMPLVYRNTKVILLSERLFPDIEKVVKKDQIMVCPNGIPSLHDTENSSKKNNEVPHLLYLSNLIVSKGVYVLLDACKTLKMQGRKFVCDFVGGETKEISKDAFEKAIKGRGLEQYVHYHGPQYGANKENFWQNADIFVFPTFYHNESFPLVLLEAMQHGLACVSTNEGGIPDIIENGRTGMICKKEDCVDLSEKIKQILDDEGVMKMMECEAKKKYDEYYTLRCFEQNFKDCIANSI